MENKGPLKVLLVCNNAFVKGNGLCTAVQSTVKRLRAAGVDARLMAAVNADSGGVQPDFPLKHFKFPIFEPIVYANGFRYALADSAKIKEAVQWADVVHVEEAFPLEIKAVDMARELGKPVVGTFHLYPENIMANLGLGRATLISDVVLSFWRDLVFNKCSHVQCPTEFVKNHLLKHKFTSDLRVIPNGIDISGAVLPEPSKNDDGPVKILCIGRLSNEKDQMTLLKAMKYSRHSGEIELHFAGKGPKYSKYKRFSDKLLKDGVLRHEPVFGFYGKEELARLCAGSYLYIHCAWVEVEGLSCIEALREGTVPVIAGGGLSATSQFALDERSIFPVRDAKALAERIDWWIEHREEHVEMKIKYAASARQYDQKICTQKLLEMYRDAIGNCR